jgi:hypothetical protein
MKNKNNQFADQLLGQESVDASIKAGYEKRIADMVDYKIHWLLRILCAVAALGGFVFSIFLCGEFLKPFQHDLKFIIKISIFLLMPCVVFYTKWAADVAIRGKSRFGSAPSVILGALVASGFFACLWSFLIFVLPKLMQLFHEKSEYPFVSDIWIIGTVCMFLIIGLFGVLTAGITFILHLLCKYHSQNHRKLLEIEMALAELSEKKANHSPSN